MKKVFFLTLGIVAALSLMACESTQSSGNLTPAATLDTIPPTTSPSTTSTTPSTQSIISTTVNQFILEFSSNELAFNAKYLNHIVRLTGKIQSIGSSGGIPRINFNADGFEVYSVYAFFETNSSALMSLSKGQTVTVQGTYTGTGFATLDVHNCTLA